MAKVSTDMGDPAKGSAVSDDKDKGQPDKVVANTIQESGVSTSELEALAGRIYGSGVKVVEEKDGDTYVAKIQSTSYGTGTFVIDGAGASADEARTDLWNRIPRYPDRPAGGDQSLPHDYTRPNGV